MSPPDRPAPRRAGATGPFDVLVLGSGVAGLSAAVRLAERGSGPALRIGVLTKGELSQSATRWAQGGVAAVLGGDEDSTDLHLADTLAAGAGLCDEDAVRVLVDEGPGRVHELIALGAQFDRESTGHLALAREGGHSGLGWSTPAGRPPGPRWNGPWWRPPVGRPTPSWSGGSPSTCSCGTGAAGGCGPCRPAARRSTWRPSTWSWPPAVPASSSR